MKRAFLFLAFLFALGFFTATSQAQCNIPTVTSFSLSPGTILGDQSWFAVGTVGACLPSGTTTLNLSISESPSLSGTETVCYGGGVVSGGGCVYNGVGSGSVTVTFATNGYNYTGNTQTGSITINTYNGPPYFSQPLTVTSAADPYEVPSLDPDGPCPCTESSNPIAGHPINVTNGNTWIPQQDYFMPGIGGGLTLTRTWNSLWANMNPPETAGIFGDSWRSTFEERIQVLTGGVVKYWKGNGSSLFYAYNSMSGTYSLTAPLDEQTTLSFNSATSQWIVTEKNGTQRIFNNAGFLTSIVDLNGNTTTINVDASHQSRIASVTDPSGHILTFHYTDANNPRLCTGISDSVGTATQYLYDDGTKRLMKVTYPDASQFNFTYKDSSSTLISLVTDSNGKTIEAHGYDSLRRGTSSQQANDSNGSPVNLVTVNYATPNAWENLVCDSTGNDCVSVQVSNRNQRHYISLTSGPANNACNTCGFLGMSSATFNSAGYSSSSVDGNGNTTLYNYDASGNLLSKSQFDYFRPTTWDTWNYTYNSFGEVLTVTDPLGQAGDPNYTTVYGYNAQGNLTSITTPSPDFGVTPPSVTNFTPNSQGQVTQIQDPLGNLTTIVYCTTNQTNCPYGLIYYIQDVRRTTKLLTPMTGGATALR